MIRLAAAPHERVWGSFETKPWFANPDGRRIGEIWFAASPEFPLLVKLLFTSARMSVQVHPDDEYARIHEKSRGKTEMWHVLRAEPGAEVALGLRERITKERLREAAVSGEIEKLLNWIPTRAGDTFFVPAGTIHAIGAGLVLCEVQQLSDITYRLYDYGRERELHLERALDVANRERNEVRGTSDLLVECPYFRTKGISVKGKTHCVARGRDTVYVALEGDGLIEGQPFCAGDAWEVAAGSGAFEIESLEAKFLVTSKP